VSRGLLLIHLIGLSLGLGGLFAQVLLLSRHKRDEEVRARLGSELSTATLISRVQKPGVYVSILSGVGLAWVDRWQPLDQGWFHFKLLFVFWILLASNLMARNAENILTLRAQCGEHDSERLVSLKDNHRMIGYVTLLSFVFVCIFSLWKPL